MTVRKNVDPAFATTEDVMQAAGVTRVTIHKWIERGLLPKPTKVALGYPLGTFNRFPAWVLLRARFITAKRREGLTLDEVLALLKSEGGFEPEAAVGSERGPRHQARPGPRRRR